MPASVGKTRKPSFQTVGMLLLWLLLLAGLTACSSGEDAEDTTEAAPSPPASIDGNTPTSEDGTSTQVADDAGYFEGYPDLPFPREAKELASSSSLSELEAAWILEYDLARERIDSPEIDDVDHDEVKRFIHAYYNNLACAQNLIDRSCVDPDIYGLSEFLDKVWPRLNRTGRYPPVVINYTVEEIYDIQENSMDGSIQMTPATIVAQVRVTFDEYTLTEFGSEPAVGTFVQSVNLLGSKSTGWVIVWVSSG